MTSQLASDPWRNFGNQCISARFESWRNVEVNATLIFSSVRQVQIAEDSRCECISRTSVRWTPMNPTRVLGEHSVLGTGLTSAVNSIEVHEMMEALSHVTPLSSSMWSVILAV